MNKFKCVKIFQKWKKGKMSLTRPAASNVVTFIYLLYVVVNTKKNEILSFFFFFKRLVIRN